MLSSKGVSFSHGSFLDRSLTLIIAFPLLLPYLGPDIALRCPPLAFKSGTALIAGQQQPFPLPVHHHHPRRLALTSFIRHAFSSAIAVHTRPHGSSAPLSVSALAASRRCREDASSCIASLSSPSPSLLSFPRNQRS